MIRIKFSLIFFLLSTRLLFSQNNIDSISKIISFLENKTWQIHSVEAQGQLPEFGLDTTIVYSFGAFITEEKKIKGEISVDKKDIKKGEVIVRIMIHYPSYNFLLTYDDDKIKIDYGNEEFSDEILEINERFFKVKRWYKHCKNNNAIIIFKKLW